MAAYQRTRRLQRWSQRAWPIATGLFLLGFGALALFADVATSNEHYTKAHYDKYVDACLSEAVENLNTDEKMQKWLNKCIPDKAGTKTIRKTGWAPIKPSQGPDGRPSIKPWQESDPRAYEAYQFCMGRDSLNCEAKCARAGKDQQKTCLPQCIESLHNCILNYHYDVTIAQNCQPGVYWFNPNPKNVWLPAQAVMDDRKMPHLYQCLAPFAKQQSYCRDCHQLTRCTAVCRNGDLKQIEGSRNVAECVAGCKKYWFESSSWRLTRKHCPSGPCLPFP